MATLTKNDVQLDVSPNAEGQLLLQSPEPEFVEVSDEEAAEILDLGSEEEETEDSIEVEEEEEEEVEKPTKKSAKTKEVTTEESEEANDPIVYFGKTLKNSGIFADVDDEDIDNLSSLEDLAEVMSRQVEATVEEWKKPAMKEWMNTLIKAGYIKPEQVNVGNTIKESDIKDEKTAEKFIRYYYNGKLPEKSIQKLIDKADDVVEEARGLVPDYNEEQKFLEIKAAKELERQEKEQEIAREQLYQDIKKNVDLVSEFIPGKKINSSTKEKVYNNVGNVWQKINNNATKYAPILAYLDHYGILEGKFEAITKIAESDTNKKFKTLLDSKPVRGADSSSRKQHSSKEEEEFREALKSSLKTK